MDMGKVNDKFVVMPISSQRLCLFVRVCVCARQMAEKEKCGRQNRLILELEPTDQMGLYCFSDILLDVKTAA